MGFIPWNYAMFVVVAAVVAAMIVIFVTKRAIRSRIEAIMGELPARTTETGILRTVGLGHVSWTARGDFLTAHPDVEGGFLYLDELDGMVLDGRLTPIETGTDDRVCFLASTEADVAELRRICMKHGSNVEKGLFTRSVALDAAGAMALKDATNSMKKLLPALSIGHGDTGYDIGGIVVETLDIPPTGPGLVSRRVTIDWVPSAS